MTYTTNYQLPQWVKSDRIMMDDFNDTNSKIDAALKAQADALTEFQENLGDCKWAYSTYSGNGTYGPENPTTLTFPAQPLLVAIVSKSGTIYCFTPGAGSLSPGSGFVTYSWVRGEAGVTLSWYHNGSANQQFNTTATYYVFTVYAIQ